MHVFGCKWVDGCTSLVECYSISKPVKNLSTCMRIQDGDEIVALSDQNQVKYLPDSIRDQVASLVSFTPLKMWEGVTLNPRRRYKLNFLCPLKDAYSFWIHSWAYYS